MDAWRRRFATLRGERIATQTRLKSIGESRSPLLPHCAQDLNGRGADRHTR